ncbi:hypothetical protein WJX73_008293 [Symbiochloris irregularis]|uniref:Leucine-rich repeat-containing N-terminal plant-type domain-containing protein n=1 Tax=Symbiochloris irregularis TaxID=706552 RepID=A0AAW1NYV6_9CHLO
MQLSDGFGSQAGGHISGFTQPALSASPPPPSPSSLNGQNGTNGAPGVPGTPGTPGAPSNSSSSNSSSTSPQQSDMQEVWIQLGRPRLRNWGTDQNVCTSWQGVTCTDNLVTSLALDNTGLNGTLPENLSSITSLETLNISNNALSGTLPRRWSQLSSLQMLNLQDNRLTGELPSQWGGRDVLPELSVLNVGSNRFSGSLPSSWAAEGAMRNLTIFSAKGNNISGTLPPVWGRYANRFPSLMLLTLDNNSLSGPLPSAWSSGWSSLALLSMANNKLTGQLPSSWAGGFSQLQILVLYGNDLSGALPSAWDATGAFPAMSDSTGHGLVAQPGNDELRGVIPSGLAYQVLRYNGDGNYTRCSQFPCTPADALVPAPQPALAPAPAPEEPVPAPAPFFVPAPAPSPAVVYQINLGGLLGPLSAGQGRTVAAAVAQILQPVAGVSNVAYVGSQSLSNAALSPSEDSVSISSIGSNARRRLASVEGLPVARQLLQVSSSGVAANVAVTADASSYPAIQAALNRAISSGALSSLLNRGGLSVSGVSLGNNALPLAPAPAPSRVPAPAPAPSAETTVFRINLGGNELTAPLTPEQAAILEGAINDTLGGIPGVQGINIDSVENLSRTGSLTQPTGPAATAGRRLASMFEAPPARQLLQASSSGGVSAQISVTGTSAGVAAAQQALGRAIGDGSLVDALSAAGLPVNSASSGANPLPQDLRVLSATDLANAAPAPLVSVLPSSSSRRRLMDDASSRHLLQASQGVQAEIGMNAPANSYSGIQSAIENAVQSGRLQQLLNNAGFEVSSVGLGNSPQPPPPAYSPPPPIQVPSSSSGGGGGSGGAIGGAVGGVVAAALIAAGLWWYCRRRKQRKAKPAANQEPLDPVKKPSRPWYNPFGFGGGNRRDSTETPPSHQSSPSSPRSDSKLAAGPIKGSVEDEENLDRGNQVPTSPKRNPSWRKSMSGKKKGIPQHEFATGATLPRFMDKHGADHGAYPDMPDAKTDALLYSQYRKARIEKIRSSAGLNGVNEQGNGMAPADDATFANPAFSDSWSGPGGDEKLAASPYRRQDAPKNGRSSSPHGSSSKDTTLQDSPTKTASAAGATSTNPSLNDVIFGGQSWDGTSLGAGGSTLPAERTVSGKTTQSRRDAMASAANPPATPSPVKRQYSGSRGSPASPASSSSSQRRHYSSTQQQQYSQRKLGPAALPERAVQSQAVPSPRRSASANGRVSAQQAAVQSPPTPKKESSTLASKGSTAPSSTASKPANLQHKIVPPGVWPAGKGPTPTQSKSSTAASTPQSAPATRPNALATNKTGSTLRTPAVRVPQSGAREASSSSQPPTPVRSPSFPKRGSNGPSPFSSVLTSPLESPSGSGMSSPVGPPAPGSVLPNRPPSNSDFLTARQYHAAKSNGAPERSNSNGKGGSNGRNPLFPRSRSGVSTPGGEPLEPVAESSGVSHRGAGGQLGSRRASGGSTLSSRAYGGTTSPRDGSRSGRSTPGSTSSAGTASRREPAWSEKGSSLSGRRLSSKLSGSFPGANSNGNGIVSAADEAMASSSGVYETVNSQSQTPVSPRSMSRASSLNSQAGVSIDPDAVARRYKSRRPA